MAPIISDDYQLIDKPKILIVDDKRENLIALQAILGSVDADIVEASSGMEALNELLMTQFSLVILDVQMPEMDGFEVAELMNNNSKTKGTPIIFVTAISKEDQYVYKGYDSGAVDYLFKPFDPTILLSKVKVFLDLYCQKQIIEHKNKELETFIHKMKVLQGELEEANKNLTDLSVKDGLTKVYNRRYFDGVFIEECRRAIRNQLPMSVIMVDIDNFKSYNDTYGHMAGDDCLIRVAECLAGCVNRPGDILARYGGEEFVYLLPETDHVGAEYVAQSACDQVRQLNIPHAGSETRNVVTVSLGICSHRTQDEDSVALMIKNADETLYKAKQMGKDQYLMYQHEIK